MSQTFRTIKMWTNCINVSNLRQVGGFLQVLQFPPPIKTDRHDITEILLKVALSTINQTKPNLWMMYWIQHYVINFVSDLRQVGGFPRVLRRGQVVIPTAHFSDTQCSDSPLLRRPIIPTDSPFLRQPIIPSKMVKSSIIILKPVVFLFIYLKFGCCREYHV